MARSISIIGDGQILPFGPYSNVANIVNGDFWGAPVIRASDGTLTCPGFIGETFATNPWDFVEIINLKTPGICDVEIRKERLLDRKKPAGRDSARLTYTGLEPALVTIRVMVWTPEQYEELKSLWKFIFPIGQPNPLAIVASSIVNIGDAQWPPAYTVHHPALAMHSVSSIAFLGAEGPTTGPGPRMRTFTIRAIEYVPVAAKQNAVKTVVAEKGSTFDPVYPKAGEDPENTGRTG